MKTIVVLAVSIVLVSIFFCPMMIAAPVIPSDIQIVQPDPSLPKELSAFFGRWESTQNQTFLIVAKINEKEALLYYYVPWGDSWHVHEAKVVKVSERYKLYYYAPKPFGTVTFTVTGDIITVTDGAGGDKFARAR
jgi:hypothetical protein